jgi:hypothetical protein
MSRVARHGSTWVTSSCLSKYGEGAGFPFQVEALEDGVNDAIHAFDIHKTHHGPGSPAHLHEAALDDVGCSTVRFDSSYCPVPESLTTSGDAPSLFDTLRLAVRLPRCNGLNTRVT